MQSISNMPSSIHTSTHSERQLPVADAAGFALDKIKALGQQADIWASTSKDFEVKVADGAITTLCQATHKGLGIRIFVDGRLGFCTTSDLSPRSLAMCIDKALHLAKQVTPDPNHRLPDTSTTQARIPELDLFDTRIVELPVDEKIALAHRLEQAARNADPRIKKFRDSGVSTSVVDDYFLNSHGLFYHLPKTQMAMWSTPVAQAHNQLQTEFWYDAKSHLEDLQSAEEIGHQAGRRAARMLGAKAIATGRFPIIFEPMLTAGLMGGLLAALDGDTVYKKASFLHAFLQQSIANPMFSIIDDPLRQRGTASSFFDGEGLATYKKDLVHKGVLQHFLYDSYSARKAGVSPSANAQRSLYSLPTAGAFNCYIPQGAQTFEQLLQSVPKALVVTRGLGQGLNVVTGEYSRGANGLWIESGEIVHPVQEVTIAGQFLEMLRNIDALGSDLLWRGSRGAPSLRIAEMTVSGR